MLKKIALIATLALAATGVAWAQSPDCTPGQVYSCFMMRAPAGQINAIAQSHGLGVHGEVTPGKPDLVLVTGSSAVLPETALENMKGDPAIHNVEPVTEHYVAELEATATIDGSNTGTIDSITLSGTYTGPGASYFTGDLWNGYAAQDAIAQLRLAETHARPEVEALGTGVVAIIDTGVDPDHPLLAGALVPGWDYLVGGTTASEWNALDPATRTSTQQNLQAAADQSYTGVVEGDGIADSKLVSTQPLLDQSYTGVVEENNLPAGFGHGTMVAGIIRLVAPGAQIMPLRVFDGDGKGDLARIVSAIYFAVANGADVINMSFSIDGHSRELERAIAFAKRNGVVCVSSAGNSGGETMTYPASYGYVFGVASVGPLDAKSPFSSYGNDWVSVGAPGEGIVTFYPGGLYAGAWGSSFSAAWVSGAALLQHKYSVNGLVTSDFRKTDSALEWSSVSGLPGDADLGYGRLDVYEMFGCGLAADYCAF